MTESFDGFYRGKRVLVTGHTGFKGSWLTTWLGELGATVIGYALDPPTEPSNFTACALGGRIAHVHDDVLDFRRLAAAFLHHRPQVVFHLAAQSLVRRSFSEPRETFEVNLMGTVNVLEAARRSASVEAVVSVTSDKCYRNVGRPDGYRETDELGGHDAYSGSKACAELALAVYRDLRFQHATSTGRELPIASARAGNVIGGGDWARDRIVPDTVRAIQSGTSIVIRSPDATRPWQHVLEPLSGYLWLGARLGTDRERCATAWNFGPSGGRPLSVAELVSGILTKWGPGAVPLVIDRDDSGAESLLLQLDSSKALCDLQWRSTWTVDETLDAIVEWYRRFLERPGEGMYEFSIEQIREFTRRARERRIAWAGP